MPIDPRQIKIARLTKANIQERVNQFCKQYSVNRTEVPLDVETIVEMDLCLQLRPEHGVKAKGGVEAFLFADRTTIMVDAYEFEKNTPRLRFTIAHEIAHFVLHEYVYRHAVFGSIDEWLNFFDGFLRRVIVGLNGKPISLPGVF